MSVTYLRSGLCSRTAASSSSLITSLRAVFTRQAPLGIFDIKVRPTDFLVSDVAGICRDRKFDFSYSSSMVATGVTPSAIILSGSTNGSNAMTFIPKPFANPATSLPTLPYACIPIVLPFSSLPVPGLNELREM